MWDCFVTASHAYDFYHLSGYHQIAQDRGEGKAALMVLEDGQQFVALPLLLRPVSQVKGLESSEYWDATSVYGYAGPLQSHQVLPDTFIYRFKEKLRSTLLDMRIISVFSRLHPLIAQEDLLVDVGSILDVGRTVAIDLTKTLEQQRADYRSNHKRDINRLRRAGWRTTACIGKGCTGERLTNFIDVYLDTMNRVQAESYYQFDSTYFSSLMRVRGVDVMLYAAELGSTVGAMGLFAYCNGIMQYHLGGTKSAFLRDAPIKLIFDDVRLWATEQGARCFHLGGGVGGKEDSLFDFKAGFSKRFEQFQVWNWIVNPAAYRELKQKRVRETGTKPNDSFFPTYRA